MKYSLLFLFILFLCGCWEIKYVDSLSIIRELEDRGCEVKYKKNKFGVYRVKCKCPNGDE